MADEARTDPFRNYRFVLTWDGAAVAAFSKAGGLPRAAPLVKPGARAVPGDFSAVTLQRGLTISAAFIQWANKVWDYPKTHLSDTNRIPLADFRKDVTLTQYDEAGRKAHAWVLRKSWPSQFTALPELDAGGNQIAIESLTLQCEGWESG